MIDTNNNGMFDIYYLFKSDLELKEFLFHKTCHSPRFKACDHIDFHTQSDEMMGLSKNERQYLTIKTGAKLDFNNGDIVYDIKNGIKWRITDFTTADDSIMKQYSLRPRKYTYINLVR